MPIKSAAVFIHGILSSPRTWDPLAGLLQEDSDISSSYELLRFGYQSPALNWRLTRRIPDFNTIADSLSTFIEVECASFDRLVLVSHSQGGLVIQRYLAKMIGQSRGLELEKIRRVILFACPNSGSEFFLVTRKVASLWKHAQERELRPLTDAVVEAQRRVLDNVVHADSVAPDRCPIPFAVYAGESDNIVTPTSAKFVFPRAGALPGDHNSILVADSVAHRTFTTLKANLLLALSEPTAKPRPASESAGFPLSGVSSAPLMKVRTTTREGDKSRSQEIEIFDAEAADLWIRKHGTSFTTQPERSDAE